MRMACIVVATIAMAVAGTPDALVLDFETTPAGLSATTSPTDGGLLDNASELNDEFVPLRITSGGLSSDPADTFPSISGLLDLTGTALGPARSGSNVVAGLEGGSGGPGTQAVIDFNNFVEIRVLDAGYTFVSEWIQLLGPGAQAQVTVCGDVNCSDQLSQTTINTSQLFSFTAPAGKEIRNVGVIPVVGGIWIDDVTLLQNGNGNHTVPEPSTALLVAIALLSLARCRASRASE